MTAVYVFSQKYDACCSLSSLGIQTLRLSILLLLCGIPAIRGFYNILAQDRVTGSDEERIFLLRQGTCHDDLEGQNANYSTVDHGSSSASNNVGFAENTMANETKGPKNEFFNTLETLRVCFHFKVSIASGTALIHLQCLIPFLWPKGRFYLQLLYIGVGLCLIIDRVLNVLVPLQLGVITDVLSKDGGKVDLLFRCSLELFSNLLSCLSALDC